MISAITRGIWAFILLTGGAVFAVAATDASAAWWFLSPPGLFAIGAASAVLGALLRKRARSEKADVEAAAPAPVRRSEPELTAAAAEPAPPRADPFDRLVAERKAHSPETMRRVPVLTREEVRAEDARAASEPR